MACWCDELNEISGYRCYDCEKLVEKNLTQIEKASIRAIETAIKKGDLKSFTKMFSKVELIRERNDPLYPMRRAEIEARKGEIMASNPDITFNELCLKLYGKSKVRL